MLKTAAIVQNITKKKKKETDIEMIANEKDAESYVAEILYNKTYYDQYI